MGRPLDPNRLTDILSTRMAHIRWVGPPEATLHWQCEICGRWFESSQSARRHAHLVHLVR